MQVNKEIHKALSSYGGKVINERVFSYLGSLGYTGSLSDRLAKYQFKDKRGWQALIAKHAGGLSPTQRLINTLFSERQQGVFYVPQPVVDGVQVLFTDAAGTIPVTADGDMVGLILDLSGNGNHASQSVSLSRPKYRTDGTLHWLEFDGVDDALVTASHPFTLTGPVSLFSGFEKSGSFDAYETLWACGDYGRTAKAMSFQIGSDSSLPTNPVLTTDCWRPSGVYTDTTISAGSPEIATYSIANWSTHKTTGTDIRLSGVTQNVESYGSETPSSLIQSQGSVGSFGPSLSTSFYQGKMYGLIVSASIYAQNTIIRSEQYLAQKSGVTLP